MLDQTIAELAPIIGNRAACAALGRSRATYCRRHRQSPPAPRQPRVPTPQPRALDQAERAEVLGVLHAEGLDQQANGGDAGTVILQPTGLTRVDRFRGPIGPGW